MFIRSWQVTRRMPSFHGLSFLQAKLGPSPVSSLGVIPDLIASFHSDPLWDWSILFLLLGKKPLNSEGLVGRHPEPDKKIMTAWQGHAVLRQR